MKENLKTIIKEWFEYKTGVNLSDDILNEIYYKLTKTEDYKTKKIKSIMKKNMGTGDEKNAQ